MDADAIANLNVVGAGQDFPETKKIKELRKDKLYLISEIKKAKTKYGERIVVHLEIDDETFSVFLPPRMVKPFEDDKNLFKKMEILIAENKLNIKYMGGFSNQIEFVIV